MRRSRGFTLIELLVVIAIIAILAAILFPVFARARAQARKTSCLSNVRQINTAIMSYAADSDGYYPIYLWQHWPAGTHYPGWVGPWPIGWNAAAPYIKNLQIFIDPAGPVLSNTSEGVNGPATPNLIGYADYNYWAGYGWMYVDTAVWQFRVGALGQDDHPVYDFSGNRVNVDGVPANIAKFTAKTDSSATRPAEMLLASCILCTNWANAAAHGDLSNNVDSTGANVGYVDGHAKWKQYKRMYFMDFVGRHYF